MNGLHFVAYLWEIIPWKLVLFLDKILTKVKINCTHLRHKSISAKLWIYIKEIEIILQWDQKENTNWIPIKDIYLPLSSPFPKIPLRFSFYPNISKSFYGIPFYSAFNFMLWSLLIFCNKKYSMHQDVSNCHLAITLKAFISIAL